MDLASSAGTTLDCFRGRQTSLFSTWSRNSLFEVLLLLIGEVGNSFDFVACFAASPFKNVSQQKKRRVSGNWATCPEALCS